MNTNRHFPESTSGAACEAFAPLLPLVAQRLLEPEEAQAVRAHLAGCGHCRARLVAYDGLDRALRRHFEQIASSPIRMEELMSRVRYEEQYDRIEEPTSAPLSIPSAPIRPARRRPRRVFSWLAAIAAVLVVALITTALVASHHPNPTTGKQHPTTNGPPPPSVTVYGSAYNDLSSSDSTIFALDGTTGKPRWTNTSSTTFRIRPVVQGGVFYIGASDGSVAAYRGSDGKLLWSQKLLTNSVVRQVVDGVVYAYSLDAPVGQVQQASLYALDARTGQQLWHFTQGASGIVVGGVIYVAGASDVTQHGAIYALNTKDGSKRWEYVTRASSAGVSQVADGLVYVIDSNPGGDGNVMVDAIDAATGQQRWSYPRSPVGQLITMGVDNGLLYLLSNEGAVSSDVPPRELYAVNTSDGSVRWHAQLELGHIQPLYSSGVIYVGTDDALAAYRASDGKLLWGNAAIHEADPALVANGVLYLNGGVIAVDVGTGNVLWQYSSGQSLFVKAVVNGLVYAVTFVTPGSPTSQVDNTIYALDSATGNVRWTHDLGREFDYYLVVS
jgi:outer membrane protein assembly factor BamB